MRGSIVWTEEEARYLRALLSWRPGKTGVEMQPAPEIKTPGGEFRILILGAKRQFAKDTLSGEDEYPSPKYERGCRRIIQIDGQAYTIDALELQSEHLSEDIYLRQAVSITDAAVLIYDVTARDTFDIMSAVTDVIRDSLGAREYSLVLVGNKSDCRDDERQVSWAEGHRLAASFRIRCSFLETSAIKGDNVNRIFPQLGGDVLKLRWLMRQRREQTEKVVAAEQTANRLPVKRPPRWKMWTRPWFHRRSVERKTSVV
ncbi:hypothetical protein DL764_004510 [Monosporascus ibericus]|uniref:small monomeric GTPase n=1 Tax=Monosporascus ibericus TaxID=155417 RepID=A0A4Q4TFV5_9PEZI|nr:hypothetical protein DL764_004510 [Monosporascus ibericus]